MNGSSWLDRNRNMVFVTLVVLTAGGVGLFYLRQPAQVPVEIVTAVPVATATPAPLPSPTPGPVRVYITGAVLKSDVYILPHGSIIKDAILAAGGLTPDADPERINQALELQDQQQIHVPRLDEADGPPPVQGGAADSFTPPALGPAINPVSGDRINLNTATVAQLDTLPGIGPVIAQRIIDYRETVGRFDSIEMITEVSGIGEATFAQIKDLIVVE